MEAKIKNLTDKKGGLASADFVGLFVKTMSEEKTTEGKQVLIQVLLNTNKSNITKKFIENNGHKILHSWIQELFAAAFVEKKQDPKLLQQCIQIIANLPLSVDVLKQVPIGKTMRKISKHFQDEPTSASQHKDLVQIIEKWLQQWTSIVSTSATPTNSATTPVTTTPPSSTTTTSTTTASATDTSNIFSSIFSSTSGLSKIPKKAKASVTPAAPLPAITPKKPLQLLEEEYNNAPSLSTTAATVAATISSSVPTNNNNSATAAPQPPPPTQKEEHLKRKHSEMNSKVSSAPKTTSSILQANKDEPSSKKKRKGISWANGEKLTRYKYFDKECPPTELSSKKFFIEDNSNGTPSQQQQQQQNQTNQHKNWKDLEQKDRQNERLFIQKEKQEKLDKLKAMNPTTHWYKPFEVVDVQLEIQRGCESSEIISRREYINRISPVVYPSRDLIPNTPAGPIQEEVEYNDANTKVFPVTSAVKVQICAYPIQQLQQQQQQQQQQQGTSMEDIPKIFDSGFPEVKLPEHFLKKQQGTQPNAAAPTADATATNTALDGFTSIPLFALPNGKQSTITPLSNNANINNILQNPLDLNAVYIKGITHKNHPLYKKVRCRFFTAKTGCRNGKQCAFYHEGEDPIPPEGIHEPLDVRVSQEMQQKTLLQQQMHLQQMLQQQQQQPVVAASVQQPPSMPSQQQRSSHGRHNNRSQQRR